MGHVHAARACMLERKETSWFSAELKAARRRRSPRRSLTMVVRMSCDAAATPSMRYSATSTAHPHSCYCLPRASLSMACPCTHGICPLAAASPVPPTLASITHPL